MRRKKRRKGEEMKEVEQGEEDNDSSPNLVTNEEGNIRLHPKFM